MNLFNKRNPAAFTLIEMIVVMLIIATLTALFMGAASRTFDRARRAQAKNDVTQLVTAINAFYTEYGRYPIDSTGAGYIPADTYYGSGTAPAGISTSYTNDKLMDVLRNNTSSTSTANGGGNLVTVLNPRGVVFLSPGGAKMTTPPRGGIVVVAGAFLGQYFDPWGSPYAIEIDGSYDNLVPNPYSDSDGSAGARPSLSQGAIAYSYGKNGALGGGSASSPYTSEGGSAGVFKGSSDILSW